MCHVLALSTMGLRGLRKRLLEISGHGRREELSARNGLRLRRGWLRSGRDEAAEVVLAACVFNDFPCTVFRKRTIKLWLFTRTKTCLIVVIVTGKPPLAREPGAPAWARKPPTLKVTRSRAWRG
jgi:hypothetical protein